MFKRSPKGSSSSSMGVSILLTFSDSPVNALSLTCKEKFCKILPSAAVTSPASKSRISPGTNSDAGTSIFCPPRMTRAFGAAIARRLSNDFCALKCCTVPNIALSISTASMTMEPSTPPVSAEMIAAIISMMTKRSANCSANTCNTPLRLPSCSLL